MGALNLMISIDKITLINLFFGFVYFSNDKITFNVSSYTAQIISVNTGEL